MRAEKWHKLGEKPARPEMRYTAFASCAEGKNGVHPVTVVVDVEGEIMHLSAPCQDPKLASVIRGLEGECCLNLLNSIKKALAGKTDMGVAGAFNELLCRRDAARAQLRRDRARKFAQEKFNQENAKDRWLRKAAGIPMEIDRRELHIVHQCRVAEKNAAGRWTLNEPAVYAAAPRVFATRRGRTSCRACNKSDVTPKHFHGSGHCERVVQCVRRAVAFLNALGQGSTKVVEALAFAGVPQPVPVKLP
jgi:hypothetical protein